LNKRHGLIWVFKSGKMYRQSVSNFQMRRKDPAPEASRSSPLTGALSKVLKALPEKKLKHVVWQIQGHSLCLPFTVGDKGRH
jgi:hypothetical protein